MASTVTRRPWPALVALLALLLLTALVWWRVLHRGGTGQTQAGGKPTCPPSSSSAPSGTASASSGPSPSGSGATSPGHAGSLPAPSAVTVKVLNSTTRQGIAGKAQAALVKAGFNSPQAAANDTAHQDKIKNVAQIRYGAKGAAGARLLHYYFPGARLVRTHTKRATVTVSLGKRYHHVATPAQVRAAMRADAVSTPTPTPSTHSSPC